MKTLLLVKVKTETIEGLALDWAILSLSNSLFKEFPLAASRHTLKTLAFSTDWAKGGPLIEENEIGLSRNAPCSKGREWEARPSITAKGSRVRWSYGPTPLVAAMRSLLGEWVEVPEELLLLKAEEESCA